MTTGQPIKVALVVDNPLRDLDGLVMVAWQLAQRGAEAYLTPMYDQRFVVEEIRPDFVLANYLRPNNIELLRQYKRDGARIGVIDTEGAVGQQASDLAGYVRASGAAGMCDVYCVWGEGQYRGFISQDVVSSDRLRLTGCPRYDYAASAWRQTLATPRIEPGFVLINTNFQANNPRFSLGPEAERVAMLRVGLDADYVNSRIVDGQRALDGMCDLIVTLARRFPSTQFVLRPHPFEKPDYYARLTEMPNFCIRQEGTSLEWVNAASLLIHLNCSTAVEAVMLDKEPLMPAWLNTPALHIDGPSIVSRQVKDPDQMVALVAAMLDGRGWHTPAELTARRQDVIRELYLAIDGEAAARVADAILEALAKPAMPAPEPSFRSRTVFTVQRLLGGGAWFKLRERVTRGLKEKREAKSFNAASISELVQRLCQAGGGASIVASPASLRSVNSAVRIARSAS